MEDYEGTYQTIFKEIIQHSTEVHDCFLQEFGREITLFPEYMTKALLNWQNLDNEIMREHEHELHKSTKKAHVVLLAYSAIALHIMGLKVFLSGLIIPAGNLMRQVVELISLASLCSGKDINVLDRFINDKYSSHKAPKDVVRCSKKVGLTKDGTNALKTSQQYYNKYSHPTMLTLAEHFPFEKPGEGFYLGASFDEGKRGEYLKDLTGRVNLAKQFSTFVDVIRLNLQRW